MIRGGSKIDFIIKHLNIIFTLTLSCIQCIYAKKSYRLQKVQQSNREQRIVNNNVIKNTASNTIEGNHNEVKVNQFNISLLDPYKLTDVEEKQRRELRKWFTCTFLILSIAHFIISFISASPSQNIFWGEGTSYLSKIFNFLGQTFQSISFVNIILSIIVLMFAFFIKRKIYFYTGLLFLAGSFLINSTLSNINIQKLLMALINSSNVDVDGIGMFKILITFIYIILCFACLVGITYLNISYICGYSKYFDEENNEYRNKRLIYPLLPVVISAIYIYLLQYHGLEQWAWTLDDFLSKLLKEFKSQL